MHNNHLLAESDYHKAVSAAPERKRFNFIHFKICKNDFFELKDVLYVLRVRHLLLNISHELNSSLYCLRDLELLMHLSKDCFSTEKSQFKVFGIGPGRTGSVSLGRALSELDLKTIHFPPDPTKKELLAGRGDLAILSTVNALVDGLQPFYAKLDTANPGSKFILTTRDVESYVRSRLAFNETLAEMLFTSSQQTRDFVEYIDTITFGSVFPRADAIRKSILRHRKEVELHFSGRSHQLLVINIPQGDGWDVLCPFLDKEIPGTQFPKGNSSADALKFASMRSEVHLRTLAATERGERFLFLDDAKLGLEFEDREAIPFPSDGHAWAGLPANSNEALAALSRELSVGYQKLIVTQPAFWWFDFYNGFETFLENRMAIRTSDTTLRIYIAR